MIATVEKVVHQGYGLTRTEDGVVFVPEVMPGEKVDIRSTERRRGALFAREFEIVEISPDRVEPFCMYFSRCGGCQWQFAPYEMQLEWKKQIFVETLDRIYGKELVPGRLITGEQRGYRRRMRFHIESRQVGFYRHASKELVPVLECPVFCQRGNELLSIFHEVYRDCPESEFSRLMRGTEIRVTSNDADCGMLFISPSGNGSKAFVARVVQHEENINAWISLSRTELPGKGFRTLAGKDYLQDCGFIVSPLSFYQPNLNLALEVYRQAAEVINNSGLKKVIDIYCGIGLLETLLNEDIEVLGIEINEFAVEDARINAFLNEKQAEFVAMDASEIEALEEAELAVVNPPRSGMHRNLIQAMNRSEELRSIIYLSCDPASFARDLALLGQGGYSVRDIWLADYYPHTYHFETVAFLERS